MSVSMRKGTGAPAEGRRAPIAVFGATGYTGGEALRLLARHPSARVSAVFGSGARQEAVPVWAEFPDLRGVLDLAIEPASVDAAVASGARIAMLCTPHEASAELAPALLHAGLRVVDLSAAFRLPDAALYPSYYGFEHPSAALLEEAVYGLAEFEQERMASARLVASPGCYPTASLLALRPLERAGALDARTRPIIDATSGVSGAGRSAKRELLFGEVSMKPYGVFAHRHGPEIETHLGRRVVFTPHVAPYFRGIVATIHAELAPGWDAPRARAALTETYADAPCVRVLPEGRWPSVAGVAGTNFCDIALASDDEGHAIIVSSIDNLLKGAAGQAVQCMNAMLDLPMETGVFP